MIGNDVIDLQLAREESRWQRHGFLQKIFTERERAFLADREKTEAWVWNLWSRKEAVYKIINRKFGLRAFIPHLLECFPESENAGMVQFQGVEYFTHTQCEGDCLHSVAVEKLEHFGLIVNIPVSAIEKKDDLPMHAAKPASKSHHGRFEKCVGFEPTIPIAI